jgi:hypothetical protein
MASSTESATTGACPETIDAVNGRDRLRHQAGRVGRRWLLLATVLVLGSAGNLDGQDTREPLPSALPVGARARVSSKTFPGLVHRGLLTRSDEKAINFLLEDGSELTVPIASITRLEVVIGKRRHTWKGLVIGAAWGLVGGALLFKVDSENCGFSSGNYCSRAAAVGVGVPVFAGLGAGIGALIKSDRWMLVNLDPAGRGRAPAMRGSALPLSVGVTVRF